MQTVKKMPIMHGCQLILKMIIVCLKNNKKKFKDAIFENSMRNKFDILNLTVKNNNDNLNNKANEFINNISNTLEKLAWKLNKLLFKNQI